MHLPLPASNSNQARQICLCNLDLVTLTQWSWRLTSFSDARLKIRHLPLTSWLLTLTAYDQVTPVGGFICIVGRPLTKSPPHVLTPLKWEPSERWHATIYLRVLTLKTSVLALYLIKSPSRDPGLRLCWVLHVLRWTLKEWDKREPRNATEWPEKHLCTVIPLINAPWAETWL